MMMSIFGGPHPHWGPLSIRSTEKSIRTYTVPATLPGLAVRVRGVSGNGSPPSPLDRWEL